MADVFVDYTLLLLSHVRELADSGDRRAQAQLGMRFMHGILGAKKNVPKGVRWTLKAATSGNAQAQHNMGFCCERGIGVDKDDAISIEWYKKSAVQGIPDAQAHLGRAYQHGEGVDKDLVEAEKWYHLAAQQGHTKAQGNMGLILTEWGRQDEAEHWYRLAAEEGDTFAMSNLGTMLHGRGLSEEAFIWFQRASDLNAPHAMHNLGSFYLHGQGVPADRDKAMEWLSRDARQTEHPDVSCIAEQTLRNIGIDISSRTAIVPCPNRPIRTAPQLDTFVRCPDCKIFETPTVKFMTCGRCAVVKYCSKECQRKDWATHKKVCKAPVPAPAPTS